MVQSTIRRSSQPPKNILKYFTLVFLQDSSLMLGQKHLADDEVISADVAKENVAIHKITPQQVSHS